MTSNQHSIFFTFIRNLRRAGSSFPLFHRSSTTSRKSVRQVRKLSHLLWIEKLLDEFLAIFKAAQTGDGLQHIRIQIILAGNDVRLHHGHHRQLQLQFAASAAGTAGHHPRMAMDLGQLCGTVEEIDLFVSIREKHRDALQPWPLVNISRRRGQWHQKTKQKTETLFLFGWRRGAAGSKKVKQKRERRREGCNKE